MKDGAIAFDFDGTLVHSGFDKGVHIMYAAYAACAASRFRRFLHPHDPGRDLECLLRGLLQYPGAPRFQQLAALLNSLIHGRPVAVEVPEGLDLDPDLAAEYDTVRRTYDATYTALNDAAAGKYWTVALGTRRLVPGMKLIEYRRAQGSTPTRGIDTVQAKVVTLAFSAFLAGVAGGFYGMYFRYVDPDAVFPIALSVEMVFIAVVGGLATVAGPIIGAIFLVTVSELFRERFLASRFPETAPTCGSAKAMMSSKMASRSKEASESTKTTYFPLAN